MDDKKIRSLKVVEGDPLDLVIKDEFEIINNRRKRIEHPYVNDNDDPPVPEEKEGEEKSSGRDEGKSCKWSPCKTLIGLSLSGGGIRSATTNIGVLQGLSEQGVLRHVDYLSSVSGGGYIGACLSSLLATTAPNSPCDFTTEWKRFPFREDKLKGKSDDNKHGRDQMQHLRVRASFLAPRARHLSTNVMRALGAVFGSTFVTLAWFVLLLTIITSAYMFFVLLVAPDLKINRIGGVVSSISSTVESDGGFSFSVEAKVTGKKGNLNKVDSSSMTDELKKIFEYATEPFEQFEGAKWPESYNIKIPPSLIIGVGVFLFGGLAAWFGLWLICRFNFLETKYGLCLRVIFYWLLLVLLCGSMLLKYLKIGGFAAGAILVVPSLFTCGALIATGVFYCLISRDDRAWNIDCRSQFQKIAGVLFVFLLLTLVLAVLPGFMVIGTDRYAALLMCAIGVGLRYAITSSNDKSPDQATFFSLPSKYTEWLLGIFTWLFLFLAVIYVGNVISESFLDDMWPGSLNLNHFINLSAIFLVSLGLLVLFHFLVDANKISAHYFYRDRLAETFLDTICPDDSDHRWSRNDKEMSLANLHGNIYEDEGSKDNGPYLLLNATLNLTASKDLKSFNRKSDIFTFSRLYVGSKKTGYLKSEDYMVDGAPLKLARAMTISGAAVTSVMGMNSSLITSFICTIFGVRLGYWLPNFKNEKVRKILSKVLYKWERMEQIKQCIEKIKPPSHCKDLRSYKPAEIKELEKQLRRLRRKVTESPHRRLLNEMFSHTTATDKEIYLSDGGHSGDNLGIIPLLRRRVRVLMVSDSECDPDHAFDSFNSSVRNAYVDDGIRIEISLNGLRKDENGLTRDKFAVGRILYPGQDKDKGLCNWIILYKNTMTGGEISPIINYKKKSKDFPHESTADQFFTEEQFESYRALGRFALTEAFESQEKWLKACSASDRKISRGVYRFLKK